MTTHANSQRPLLEVDDLKVSYYKKAILSGLSLKIAPGEIVALIGPNGSGKSTLLKSVAGAVKLSRGLILFDGKNISNKEPNELSQLGIGFCMQGGAIFPSLTVTEHLRLAHEAQIGHSKKDFEERAEEVWTLFPQLSAVMKKRAGLLSGGERQMLSIATVLIRDLRICLMDEPTGNLSEEVTEIVLKKMQQANKEKGLTILFAEQNLNAVLRLSQRVFVLRDGLAYERTPESIRDSTLEETFFGNSLN